MLYRKYSGPFIQERWQPKTVNQTAVDSINISFPAKEDFPTVVNQIVTEYYEGKLTIETMKLNERFCPGEIEDLEQRLDEKQMYSLEKQAYTSYISTTKRPNLNNSYLIARYLYRAINNNKYGVAEHKEFIYEIHQCLSKMIRNSKKENKEHVISVLISWLVAKEDGHSRSRNFAAFALGMSKANEAGEILLGAVADPNELYWVKYYATMSLGMIRNRKHVDKLVEAYQREQDKALKQVIAHAIIYILHLDFILIPSE